MKYSLDTTFFIEGWKHYPPHIFGAYWDWVSSLIDEKVLLASQEVKEELKLREAAEKKLEEEGRKTVLGWLKTRQHVFVETDQAVTDEVPHIMRKFPHLVKGGGKRSRGDVWVIALAKINGYKVVTEETTGGSRIPSVCDHYKIKHCTIAELMDELEFRFQ